MLFNFSLKSISHSNLIQDDVIPNSHSDIHLIFSTCKILFLAKGAFFVVQRDCIDNFCMLNQMAHLPTIGYKHDFLRDYCLLAPGYCHLRPEREA